MSSCQLSQQFFTMVLWKPRSCLSLMEKSDHRSCFQTSLFSSLSLYHLASWLFLREILIVYPWLALTYFIDQAASNSQRSTYLSGIKGEHTHAWLLSIPLNSREALTLKSQICFSLRCQNFLIFVYLFALFVALSVEFSILYTLGKWSTTKIYSQIFFFLSFFFWQGLTLSQVGLELILRLGNS